MVATKETTESKRVCGRKAEDCVASTLGNDRPGDDVADWTAMAGSRLVRILVVCHGSQLE